MRCKAGFAVVIAALALSSAPVRADAPVVAATGDHSRVLPLQGGRNFRDLGGYRSADGRSVKWRVLFRSGSMTGLTANDYAYLEKLGIRVVCDLRDNRERIAEPVQWPAAAAPQVLSSDYLLDQRAMLPAGPPVQWTAEAARASLAAQYPRLLAQFNGQYRRMFAELLAGHAPLAFNCSAGKDRTGIAAALLLTALGVPRATVIEDYLLTNQTLDTGSLAKSGAISQLPAPAIKAMLAADPSYIAAAFAVIDAHVDGADGYLRDELGLGAADIAHLRGLYLE